MGRKDKVVVSGLSRNAKPYFISRLLNTPYWIKRPGFLICENKKEEKHLAEAFSFWKSFLNLEKSITNFDSENLNKIIFDILFEKPKLYVFNTDNLNIKIPSFSEIKEQIYEIKKNKNVSFFKLLKNLYDFDYQIADSASLPGYFAKKGGVVEIFPLTYKDPARIEFEGDKIVQISSFDASSKRKIKNLNNIFVPTLKELSSTSSNVRGFLAGIANNTLFITPEVDFFKKNKNIKKVIISDFTKGDVTLDTADAKDFAGNFETFKKEFDGFKKRKFDITIFSDKTDLFEKLSIGIKVKKPLTQLASNLGFYNYASKQAFFFNPGIFKPQKQKLEKRKVDKAFISALKKGDYAVHIDHGIGRFIGMDKINVDKGIREYFILEYAGPTGKHSKTDKLFVPVDCADKLNRYIGRANPMLHRLHGALWHQTKLAIKEKTREIAHELLKLYATRAVQKRKAYSKDSIEQIELEHSFKYEDTPDQSKVTEEIKQDLEKEEPMDRLLVGDVGFGKTEISVRIAFKAASEGKQVALLCPTTILAEQHYKTYKKRLKNFKVSVDRLSRFKNLSEQKETVNNIQQGKIDIIIGTHRLLSKDIKFKNLGLIIVDEEQRFGVEHKERLKKMRKNVDVLSMSATPIPRTLNFALCGLRKLSTIHTPPPSRKPIKTKIVPYDEKTIKETIYREFNRNGQVYLLHNRVETIDAFKNKMEKIMPDVKFAVAHGQLEESKLAEIMQDFYNKKFDVLVCSTIIESGLDIENVNTILVDDATRFGLSDLYQLRGRIGRGKVKGYAYFFYKSANLHGKAKERLKALLEARELGAGFEIANRDLQIRGAGSILGREQSGNIKAIGLSLYSRLLFQSIRELETGEEAKPELDISVNLPLDAFLPKEMYENEQERIKTYQELSNIRKAKDLKNQKEIILRKMKSEFAKSVRNFFYILEIKLLCQDSRIHAIDTRISPLKQAKMLTLSFAESIDDKKFYKLLQMNPSWIKKGCEIKIDFDKLGKDWTEKLKHAIRLFHNGD